MDQLFQNKEGAIKQNGDTINKNGTIGKNNIIYNFKKDNIESIKRPYMEGDEYINKPNKKKNFCWCQYILYYFLVKLVIKIFLIMKNSDYKCRKYDFFSF